MLAGLPINTVDGCNFYFLSVNFHLLNLFLVLISFLYFSTVRMICMFQSSKGFKRRIRTCCLQKVEINVHTFLYV